MPEGRQQSVKALVVNFLPSDARTAATRLAVWPCLGDTPWKPSVDEITIPIEEGKKSLLSEFKSLPLLFTF